MYGLLSSFCFQTVIRTLILYQTWEAKGVWRYRDITDAFIFNSLRRSVAVMTVW